MGAPTASRTETTTPDDGFAWVNEVRLSGRVSGDPEEKTLPSGDAVVLFRLVVRRTDARRPAAPKAQEAPSKGVGSKGAVVDTLDVSCWSARARRSALRLRDGDAADVSGSLHRRFFRAGGAAASRYEVAADTVAKGRR